MATEHTPEEVHQRYVGTMGKELGELYFRLGNECVLLHWKWEEYVALFGTTSDRIALLNEAAGAFFRIVQDSLWYDVLLLISRLTDPPRSSGKDNLTVQRLPMIVDAALQAEIRKLLQECLAACAFARDWRMRRLAHRDLALALQHPTAKPLSPASRKAVRDALQAIAAVLNAVDFHYCNSTVMYEIRAHNSAESLLYVLRDGLRMEAERMERIRSGTFTDYDLKPDPPV